jgi:hypothetical protein
LMD